MDLRRGDDALVEDLAFDPGRPTTSSRNGPTSIPAAWRPRTSSGPPAVTGLVPDPVEFNDRDRQRVQRQLFFGTWRPAGMSAVRSCLPVPRGVRGRAGHSSSEQLEGVRERILLGLSRLLGAPGYRAPAWP